MSRRELELKKLYVLTPQYYDELIKQRVKPQEDVSSLKDLLPLIIQNKNLNTTQKWLLYRQALLNKKMRSNKSYIPQKDTKMKKIESNDDVENLLEHNDPSVLNKTEPYNSDWMVEYRKIMDEIEMKELAEKEARKQKLDDYLNSQKKIHDVDNYSDFAAEIFRKKANFKPTEKINETNDNQNKKSNKSHVNIKRKAQKHLRFNQNRSLYDDNDDFDDIRRLSTSFPNDTSRRNSQKLINNRRMSEVFNEVLPQNISDLFNQEELTYNNNEPNTSIIPAIVNQDLEYELHKKAQEIFNEENPQNIERDDRTLGRQSRRFIHKPTLEQVDIDVLPEIQNLFPDEYENNNSNNFSFEQINNDPNNFSFEQINNNPNNFSFDQINNKSNNVSFEKMDTIPSKRKSMTPRKSLNKSPNYIALRNRKITRHGRKSLEAIRAEKKLKRNDGKGIERILNVADRPKGSQKLWNRDRYKTHKELKEARLLYLIDRVNLATGKWKQFD